MFWCPLSLYLTSSETFLGVLSGFGGWKFHLLITGSMTQPTERDASTRSLQTMLICGREPLSW
jgi:hypothetical protein